MLSRGVQSFRCPTLADPWFSTPLELRCFRRRLRSRDGPFKLEPDQSTLRSTVDPPSQGYHNERFHCVDPRNPVGWQLTCTEEAARPDHIDEKKSLAILHSASVVGILEAYQESICLYSAKLRRRCFKKESWTMSHADMYLYIYIYVYTYMLPP